MAHEVAHGDGFPEVGEADDFDIDAFVEAARAVDMAGIRAGVSQQEQGNEAIYYEANPFASMVSRGMTPILQRLRAKSRSPRRNAVSSQV